MKEKGKGKAKDGKGKGKGKNSKEEMEERVKTLRRFMKTYETICKNYNVVPAASILQKVKSLVSDEEGPKSLTFPLIIDSECLPGGIQAIIETLANYQYYNRMAFWRANIGDEGLTLLCSWLRTDCYLKGLELMDNKITSLGCQALSTVLQNNETLTSVMLDYNEIGDEGATLLSKGIEWNPTLQSISLRYCCIGEEGGAAVGRAISGSKALRDVDLQGNPLGPMGITAIAEGIKRTNSLVKLNLADTSFGHDLAAIEALGSAIEVNTTLEDVNLHLNNLVPEGAVLLADVVTTKKNIKSFLLYERMNKELFAQVMNAVTANNKKKGKGKRTTKSKKKK